MHYQPICRVDGAAGPGWVEFLIRGCGRSACTPAMRVVEAGYRALGLDFDLEVIEAALDVAATLHPSTRFGINIHPHSLTRPAFAGALQAGLDRHKIAGDRLVLELVEFDGPVDLGKSRATIDRLKRAGVRFALDDFGPGAANFDVLAAGLIDYVKLDRSLINAIGKAPRQHDLLAGIASLAVSIGAELVAEGVETTRQMVVLRSLGICWMQGFLFGRPGATRVEMISQPPERLRGGPHARPPGVVPFHDRAANSPRQTSRPTGQES